MQRLIEQLYQNLKNRKRKYPIPLKALLEKMDKSQYWDRERTVEYQLKQLNYLVREARSKTDYYNEVIPDTPSEFADLKEYTRVVPKLQKADIYQNAKRMIDLEKDNRFVHTTSGSTGKPLSIEISSMAKAYRRVALMRFLSWWGVDEEKDRSVLVWGFKKTRKRLDFVQDFIDKLRKRLVVNVFELDDDTIHDYFQRIEKYKPTYMRGYKSGVHMLATLMEKHNLEFKNCRLKVVVVTSEILYEEERAYMEKVLKCRIANEYGAAESGLLAGQCPEGSIHINEESVYLTTDEDRQVILTELHNDSMPLLNYMNNDRIYISEDYCKCGRTSRLIDKIDGRVNEFIICPDGTVKHQSQFYYIMVELNDLGYEGSVKQYKIIQDGPLFKVQLVQGAGFDKGVTDYIEKRFKEEFGDVRVEFELVERIARDKSGKLRFFIRIKQPGED